MNATTNVPAQTRGAKQEAIYLALAREVAMDIVDIEDILKSYSITQSEFEDLLTNPHFQSILSEQVKIWNAAPNTGERLKYKHQSAVEEALPEMFARLHDRNEPLSSKVELFKALQKGAGMLAAEGGDATGKVSITINMGDRTVDVTQKVTPVIDHEDALDV